MLIGASSYLVEKNYNGTLQEIGKKGIIVSIFLLYLAGFNSLFLIAIIHLPELLSPKGLVLISFGLNTLYVIYGFLFPIMR